jgi:hypothetical protein
MENPRAEAVGPGAIAQPGFTLHRATAFAEYFVRLRERRELPGHGTARRLRA